jgi:Ca2+:H+ antiporter
MYNEPSRKAESKRAKAEGSIKRGVAAIGRDLAGGIGGQNIPEHEPESEEEEVLPELSVITALITLAISTVLVAICAEFMVGSIDALSETGNISKTFVRLQSIKGEMGWLTFRRLD